MPAAPAGVSWPPPSRVAAPLLAGERTGQLSWLTEGSQAGAAWEQRTAAPGGTSAQTQACTKTTATWTRIHESLFLD